MNKEELYDETIGRFLCFCNVHDKIKYYPRGDAQTADVEVTLCRRCAKELNRVNLREKKSSIRKR